MDNLEQTAWLTCYFFLALQSPLSIVHSLFYNALGGSKGRRFGLVKRFFDQLLYTYDSQKEVVDLVAGVNNLAKKYNNCEVKKENYDSQEIIYLKFNISVDIYCEIGIFIQHSKTEEERDLLTMCWTTAHKCGIYTEWQINHCCPQIKTCSCKEWRGNARLIMFGIVDNRYNGQWMDPPSIQGPIFGVPLAEVLHQYENEILSGISSKIPNRWNKSKLGIIGDTMAAVLSKVKSIS